MDTIAKALKTLTAKERVTVKKILTDLANRRFGNFDRKKLKGRDDIFRIRKGKIRIIYRIDQNGSVFILVIEWRNDTTYNF